MQSSGKSHVDDSATSHGLVGGVLDAVMRGARSVREKVAIHQARARIARELESLDDAGLADLGFTRDQIQNVVSAYPAGAELLPRMLAKLGLDAAKLDRPLQNDLYRTCVMCQNRKQCRHWLESDRAIDGYRDFCLNSWVLDLLRQKRERKSVEVSRKAS